MVERVVQPGVAADLGRLDRRDAAADDLVGGRAELQQPGADDVGALDERQLRREPVRHGDVVGVLPGDDVVAAGGQPRVQGRTQPAVALQRHQRDRHRAVGLQPVEDVGQLRAYRAVAHDDDLVRAQGLVVHRAAEGLDQLAGVVAVEHGQEERERLGHRVLRLGSASG